MEAAQPEVCVEIKQGRSVVDPLLCPPCQLSLSLLFPHFYTHSRPLKTAAYCPWRNNTGPVLYNAPVQEGKRSLTVPPTCVRALLSGPADRDGRTKSTIQTVAASPRQGLDTTTPTGHATPIHHATLPFQAQRRNLVCFYNWNKSGID